MDDRTRVVPPTTAPATPMTRPAGTSAKAISRRRRFPTVYYLRRTARWRIPRIRL